MRRTVLLGLGCLTLSGCAFHAWDQLPFTAGTDPYQPFGGSENLRRAMGANVNPPPLTAEPGNVWPPPVGHQPTMEDLVKAQNEGKLPSQLPPLPGVQPEPPPATPERTPGPSIETPPAVPNVTPEPNVATPAHPGQEPTNKTGEVIQTPQGPGVTTGGTGAYKSITLPNGTTGIVVPNGNGTNTVILSNGTVETIPAPR